MGFFFFCANFKSLLLTAGYLTLYKNVNDLHNLVIFHFYNVVVLTLPPRTVLLPYCSSGVGLE